MPSPRKVDQLPAELRRWLQEELRVRGFGGYEDLAEALNARCEEEGLEVRIGKSALHAYGSEFREYALMQEQSQDEIKAFLRQMTAGQEVDVTSALFQQLTTIAFRLQMNVARGEVEVDAKGLKDMTTALNNLIRSTDLREKIAAEERKVAGAKLDGAVASGAIDADAARRAREIMGFA